MQSQINFNLIKQDNFAVSDFVVSPANQAVYDYILRWPNWGGDTFARLLFICGSKFSGKTHLCKIWQKFTNCRFITIQELEEISQTESYVMENIERFLLNNEEKLFHFINMVIEENKFLIITSEKLPTELNINLPDLASRINSFNLLKINHPDDDLLQAILLKNFADRQIRVQQEVVKYLIARIDRSYCSLQNLINSLDGLSLEHKKNITIPFIKKYIER